MARGKEEEAKEKSDNRSRRRRRQRRNQTTARGEEEETEEKSDNGSRRGGHQRLCLVFFFPLDKNCSLQSLVPLVESCMPLLTWMRTLYAPANLDANFVCPC